MPVSIMHVKFFEDGHFEIELKFDADSNIGDLEAEGELLDLFVAYSKARMTNNAEKELLALAQLTIKGVKLRFGETLIKPELIGLSMGDVNDSSRFQIATFRGKIPSAKTQCHVLGNSMTPIVHLEMKSELADGSFSVPFVEILNDGEDSQIYTGVPSSNFDVCSAYLVEGVIHIIPYGFDHILFILGLYFVCRNKASLLWQVTAFTIAHSITLGFIASGYQTPLWLAPWVEPIIALSIAAVAIENCFFREMKPWRPYVVFLFGLIHGLGFAGVLAEIGIPDSYFWLALLSFNIGVEFGQVFVLAFAALCLWHLREREWYHHRVTIPISVLIGATGLYMLIERVI